MRFPEPTRGIQAVQFIPDESKFEDGEFTYGVFFLGRSDVLEYLVYVNSDPENSKATTYLISTGAPADHSEGGPSLLVKSKTELYHVGKTQLRWVRDLQDMDPIPLGKSMVLSPDGEISHIVGRVEGVVVASIDDDDLTV